MPFSGFKWYVSGCPLIHSFVHSNESLTLLNVQDILQGIISVF